MIKTTNTLRAPIGEMLSTERSRLLSRSLQISALLYQLLAIGTFIAGLFFATSWLKAPFLGAFYEHTLLFNTLGSVKADAPEWALHNELVHLGDQLIAVNGVDVHSAAEAQNILNGFFPGETIPITVRTTTGEVKTLDVMLNAFPSADRTAYFLLPSIVSFLFLALSLWIFGMRRTESAGRAFSIFASSLSITA
ncbi:MAG TPA: hypothetical protein VHM28_12295, partial [Anaerolineales bacterium]|nr:hypothetical protein [Anaerolineales bacterium]